MIDLERLKRACKFAFGWLGMTFVILLVLSFFLEKYGWVVFGNEGSSRELLLAMFIGSVIGKYRRDE